MAAQERTPVRSKLLLLLSIPRLSLLGLRDLDAFGIFLALEQCILR